MTVHTKVAGSWQRAAAGYAKVSGSWVVWLTGWDSMKRVAFPSTTYNNVQVRLVLTPSNFDYSKARSDGGDIRFISAVTHDPNVQYLDYWVESWVQNGTSAIWVKVPTAGTTQVFMVYGKPSATSKETAFTSFMESGLRWEAFNGSALAGWAKFGGNDTRLNQGTVGSGSTQVAATVVGQSSIRWEGWLLPEEPGEYTLGHSDDDGGRAWIDDVLVYNDWAAGAGAVTSTVTFADTKPKKYVREFHDSGGVNAAYAMGVGARTGRRVNLVSNPSFEVDLATWQTGGSNVTRDSTRAFVGGYSAKMTRAGAVVLLQSDPIKCVPGQTYNWAIYCYLTSTISNFYIDMVFLNEAGGVVSDGANTNPNYGTLNSWQKVQANYTAPAGAMTMQARVVWDGGVNGDAWVDACMLEAASVTGSYVDGSYAQHGWYGTPHASQSWFDPTTRLNACRNPRFANGTSRWGGGGGCALTVSSTGGVVGGPEHLVSTITTGTAMWAQTISSDVPCMPGDPFTGSAYVRSPNTTDTAYIRLQFTDKDGVVVQNTGGTASGALSPTTWQRVSHTATAPAGAAFVRMVVRGTSSAATAGTILHVDGALLERTSTLGTYFDGSMAPAMWRGTAHDSFTLRYPTDRVNLVPNPSFNVDVAGWASTDQALFPLSWQNAAGQSGTGLARLTKNTASATTGRITTPSGTENMIPVVPGEAVYGSYYVRGTSSGVASALIAVWFKPDGTASSTASTTIGTGNPTASWQRFGGSATVPTDASYMQLRIDMSSGTGNGQYHEYDAIMVERASALGTYFDGSLAGCSWSGTADASSSVRRTGSTTVTYPFPLSWVWGPKYDPIFRGGIYSQSAVLGDVPVGLDSSVPQDVEMWLDSSDTESITYPSSVRNWLDKSGLGRHFAAPSTAASPASGTRTINSKNVLDFDGTDDYLVGPTEPMMNSESWNRWTLFVVWADDNATDAKSVLSQNFSGTLGERRLQIYQATTTNNPTVAMIKGTGTTFRAAHTANPQLVSLRHNGTAIQAKNVAVGDGSVVTTNSAPGSFADTAEIGSKWKIGARTNGTNVDTVTGWQDGAIAEVIVYRRALSDTEVDAVVAYLRAKWGI